MASRNVRDGFARREVVGLLIAGAATFQARSAGADCTQKPLPTGCSCTPDTTVPDNILRRGLLISLVADLIRDPKIRDDFNARPDEVVTRYGLAPDALATFYTMSRECMHSYI